MSSERNLLAVPVSYAQEIAALQATDQSQQAQIDALTTSITNIQTIINNLIITDGILEDLFNNLTEEQSFDFEVNLPNGSVTTQTVTVDARRIASLVVIRVPPITPTSATTANPANMTIVPGVDFLASNFVPQGNVLSSFPSLSVNMVYVGIATAADGAVPSLLMWDNVLNQWTVSLNPTLGPVPFADPNLVVGPIGVGMSARSLQTGYFYFTTTPV